MKQYDGGFDTLYNIHSTPEHSPKEGATTRSTYQNVLKKAGLAPARRGGKRGAKVLLAAAVLATATFTAAAAIYSASDAFRGVLEVHDSAAGTSQAPSVLDRTGAIIGEEERSGGVSLTLRAAVADEHAINILVDVVDTSGSPLALTQPDGSLSQGHFGLGQHALARAGGEFFNTSARYRVIDSDPTDNQYTILLTYMVSGGSLLDEPLTLHLEDLLQFAVQDGTPLKMEPDALYDLASRFGEYTEGDFRLSDYNGETDRYGYLLEAAPRDSLPLSADTPDIRIVNAAQRDGALYLQGTASSSEAVERLLDNPVLINASTGASVPIMTTGRDEDEAGGETFSVRFDGFDSLESLKGFVWYYGAGEGMHMVRKGSWAFTFQVEAENLAVKRTPNLDTVWEGYPVTITALEISPYTLFLRYTTDEATARQMFPPGDFAAIRVSDWSGSPRPLTLIMGDGSRIRVEGGSLSPGYDAHSPAAPDAVYTEFEMQYLLESVVHPDQIAAVQIGERTLPLN